MIEIKNATKYYKTQGKNKYILKNVSLKIPSDLNVGLLGKNGAGKSTLLKMLAGIDYPSSGEISSDKSFSWVMGLSQGLQPSMTGRQNVKFVARIYGKSEEQIKKIAAYVKDFSELDDYFEMPIELYSNGMKSKLSFSLCLAFDFDYLIIDEIFSVGDASFKKKSENELKNKMQKSKILIVSHSMDVLRDMCDVGIVVDSGTLTYYDHIEDAINGYNNLNKVQVKKILSSDGAEFDNINDAAKHYKVRSKSINQAINQNRGSHIFLKKLFWYEDTQKPEFQEWEKTLERVTVISSDGIIFSTTKEAYYFYKEVQKNIPIEENHIEMILQKDGFSELLKVKFTYLSEYK